MKDTLSQLHTVKTLLGRNVPFTVSAKERLAMQDKVTFLISNYHAVEIDVELETEDAAEVSMGETVEIIDVCGYLLKAGGLDPELCEAVGICDIDNVRAELNEAAQDENVSLIVINFDTPGGEATGVKELARLIAEVSNTKLLIGYCSGLCASGGYWLASQCSSFFVSDSCYVGNVGCWHSRLDLTEYNKMNGIKVSVISDGEYKTFGNPDTVMSDLEEATIQKGVSTIANDFREAITSARPNVATDNLQGQIFSGEQATDPNINLADDNFDSLEDLLNVFVRLNYLY